MVDSKNQYGPFPRGSFPVGVRTLEARDTARDRLFPCELWYPASEQHQGQDIATETRDTYTVAFPPQSKPRTQMAVRDAAARRGKYPLIVFSHSSGGGRRQSTFLCTHLSSHGYVVAALDHSELVAAELAAKPDETPDQKWARAEAWVANRVPALPLEGMYELFERTPGTKQMLILRRADHCHFMDNVEEVHESVRHMPYPGTDEMRPIAELTSGEHAHLFLRGLTLAHLDATLKQNNDAQRFLASDLKGVLRGLGVEAKAL